jgi:chorismate dehydratase
MHKPTNASEHIPVGRCCRATPTARSGVGEAAALPGPDQLLAPFRVGSVPYLNAVPLTCGLEREIVFLPPSQLAVMLRAGELDAALLSSAAVLLEDRYDTLDGIAIASRGEVKSVLLGHRRPLSEVKEVYCDTASLTSVQLLRVLLAEQGLYPAFKPLRAYANPAQMPDFVLLIGDPALDFLFASPEHTILDLGKAWFDLTQLPFVFAVWVLRRGLENLELRRRLIQAKRLGLDTLDQIIQNRPEYSCQFRREYFRTNLCFHLGPDEKRGIARFAQLLRQHRSAPVYEPRFVE